MKTLPVFSLICVMALAGCDKTPAPPPPLPATAGQPAGGGISRWLAEVSAGISLQKSEHYAALRKQGRSHNEALTIMKAAPAGAN
ncbi:MAG: hypothetical protein Q8N74_03940 [Sulfuricella sp.]|nr:hypothetical protein [Sulfuricella sp.]